MGWIILTVVAGIVAGGALMVAAGANPADSAHREGRVRVGARAVAGVAFLIWLVLSIGMSIHSVGQREVGIVYSFAGTVQGKKDPGVVFVMPWQHVKTEHVGTQRIDFNFGPDASAVSKDQQDIYAKLAVNLNVEPSDVLHLYKTVGSKWKEIVLEPRVPQDFKEVTATYLTTEIPGHREAIRKETRARLRTEMRSRGYGIEIQDVFLTNLDYSASYKQAIEAKQQQVQKTLEAQAKVGEAKANADSAIATAEGEAKATIARAKAEADSITLRGRAIKANPAVLRLEAINKLNPNAAIVFCTNGNCPSFLPQNLGK
jgi:regulator of protease activity HflC (stomatin/prohibitin superfamily)